MARRVIFPAPPMSPKFPGPALILSDRETRRPALTASKGELTVAKLRLNVTFSTWCAPSSAPYTKMENILPFEPENTVASKTWANTMLLREDGGLHHLLG
ncbi:unnamed protein product [Phytophthora fragariaefolia]|uniref:Unnamed protein product n=1 Tax=Phytophthora fragariaefolia TaxID=1490495 RepID=A0A9W6XXT0_9STRA|nr:unnamed protein product [Phytophthora fragariaefolia]